MLLPLCNFGLFPFKKPANIISLIPSGKGVIDANNVAGSVPIATATSSGIFIFSAL